MNPTLETIISYIECEIKVLKNINSSEIIIKILKAMMKTVNEWLEQIKEQDK